MSHNIIKNFIIKDKIIKIIIEDKIDKIEDNNLIDLFCIINAINTLEIKKGNEYEKAYIKLKYIDNMVINEYINIFTIVRVPVFYEFVKYFKSIKKNIEEQNVETKIDINEYLSKIENVSQEVIITMIFNIESTEKDIKIKKDMFKQLIKINNMDIEIFNIIKKEK